MALLKAFPEHTSRKDRKKRACAE